MPSMEISTFSAELRAPGSPSEWPSRDRRTHLCHLLGAIFTAACLVIFPPNNPSANGADSSAQRPAEDDGEWIRPAKDFASTRYSNLNQITTDNVSQLKLA